MNKPTVFISYSHKDEDWKDRLVAHLKVLERQELLDLWDDRRIGAGVDWYQEIQDAIDAASVAILLVSANYLTSTFIPKEEVQHLLLRREQGGLRVLPIIVRPCAWDTVDWLARIQVRPKDGHALSSGNEHQIDTDLAGIAREIHSWLESAPKPKLPEPELPEPTKPRPPQGGLWVKTLKKKPYIAALAVLAPLALVSIYIIFSQPKCQPSTAEFAEPFVNLSRWATPPSGWSLADYHLNIENQESVGGPNGLTYRNFTMSFLLKLTNAGGAAWALRVQNSKDYYLFYLAGVNDKLGPDGAPVNPGFFYTYITRDKKSVPFGNPTMVIPELAADDQYTITIIAKGNEITHFINSIKKPCPSNSSGDPSIKFLGCTLGFFEDNGNTYPCGGIGFRTVGSEKFSIAELSVRPLELKMQ